MKTVFIINPQAGQGEKTGALIDSIREAIAKIGAEAQIYVTKAVGDATEYVKQYCAAHGSARFIACGGDGTLSEVLNGAIGLAGNEVGVIPIGTGNDFCRNFEGETFDQVLNQMTGTGVECDAIAYHTILDKTERQGYCMNMCNIGFDCNVADLTAEMKKKPLLSGSLAYFISIFLMLIKKKGADLKIKLDGTIRHNGRLLLTSIANGCYCGGGIKSNPLASVKDGLININIVKNVSRLRFLSLLPSYMKGTVLGRSGVERYILSEHCRQVTVIPNGGKMRLCIDGEIIDAGITQFKIVPQAFRFVVPGGGYANREEPMELGRKSL